METLHNPPQYYASVQRRGRTLHTYYLTSHFSRALNFSQIKALLHIGHKLTLDADIKSIIRNMPCRTYDADLYMLLRHNEH